MKILMAPHVNRFRDNPKTESGIRRVIEAYFKHLPEFGVELVSQDATSYDLKAVHAGMTGPDCDICHCHGLHWTGDYQAESWEWRTNQKVIAAIRHAKEITVPSSWVAETFQRDMHFTPHVIPHGIDYNEWEHNFDNHGYVLWNKNRAGVDVCDPEAVGILADTFPEIQFVTTFAPKQAPNIHEIGLRPHAEMKRLVQQSGVYLSTAKETFGIGILEAMASGVPVLGFAEGGILDLVQHGVSGYLADPGDWEDLKSGLVYCVEHRSVLAGNGLELIERFGWDKACEKVAAVYEKALAPDLPTCAIIIPSYKYAEKVGNAIESAISQTYNQLTDIIVVDDGSPDGGATERIVNAYIEHDSRVRYLRQDNSGVAVARNAGIAACKAKYLCCLDADDAIEPEFISTCVEALEADRSLGIAFTKLKLKLPDGRIYKKTRWPESPDFGQQLMGKNQVPTCCVFRRLVWERLGGYRQRYAPYGCGVEDAEFWTRIGAAGWGMTLASPKPLFIYSFGEGGTTGDRSYKELDWLAWHPWAQDAHHPFASIAPPAFHSHPVRQYDSPVVSVVIPVGPGHEKQVLNAIDSLEAQTFRQWEAVITWDSPDKETLEKYKIMFPFVYWIETEGGVGAGKARNLAMEETRGGLTLFLDADDWLYPEAIELLLEAYSEEGGDVAVYPDYVGLAFIDDPGKLDPKLQSRIIEHRPDGRAVIGNQGREYDQEQALRQPILRTPYLWNTVVTMFPTIWHNEIGGFDEKMESWEDWDYWIRMARAGKAFIRVPQELFVYQFYSGQRRQAGLQNAKNLVQYMQEKYKGIEIIMCKRCKKPRAASPVSPSYNATAAQRQRGAVMSDNDFTMCKYTHGNRGDHHVVGPARFRERIQGIKMIPRMQGGVTVYIIDYGQKGGGSQFLVHRRDIELAPQLFQPKESDTMRIVLPQARAHPLAAPSAIRGRMDDTKAPVSVGQDPIEALLSQIPKGPQVENVPAPRVQGPPIGRDPIADLIAQIPQGELDRLGISDLQDVTQDARPVRRQSPSAPDLQVIPGLSANIMEQLIADGIQTPADLQVLISQGGLERLMRYRGIGKQRAETIAAAVLELVPLPTKADGVPPELAGIISPG